MSQESSISIWHGFLLTVVVTTCLRQAMPTLLLRGVVSSGPAGQRTTSHGPGGAGRRLAEAGSGGV